ncbi:hypothetical protein GALMADRAFT_219276 [Galerina marginata CBS 339.88]|uniref:Single-stranded DNA-binding protein n=1 Tax=Galerina marginata (strain CBS 339.88) TaxID=685588 RepID=A0A067TU98_GALM3|nr:hypothetical protein GALMADRAFT_219276 [Galerina marginata CBS 339.88]
MFSVLRVTAGRSFSARAFSTSSSRASDLSKLVLIGHLAKDPEARQTKNDKEFITYTVATRNAPPPPDANGERRASTSTFHRIISFNEGSNNYLRTLKKGSKVYVETTFELKEPEAGADASSPQGQRQIFLRHETIRVLNYPKQDPEQPSHESSPF